MVALTEPVIRLIRHPHTSKVLATVSPGGEPHMIVCGSLSIIEPDTIVVGEVYMHRTAATLERLNMTVIAVWTFEALEVWDESASDSAGDRVI